MRSILRHCGSEQQQPSCLVARPHWAATQFISSPMFPLAWGRVAHSYFVAGERADLGRWPRSWGSLRCTAHRHRTRGTPLRRGTGQSERLMTQATLPLHARISGWRHFQFSFRATHFATQVLPAHPPFLAHLSSSTGGGGGGGGRGGREILLARTWGTCAFTCFRYVSWLTLGVPTLFLL